eukprot:g18499.t1
MAVDCSSGCELHSVHRVPGATGCYVSGLQPDGLYRFAIRAVNAYGAGPLSEEALVTDLQVEDANASGVAPLLITLDGNASAPVRTTTATVSSDTWRDAVPGRSYRAALRARSDEAISEWSEWSESRFCISEPGLPNPPQRDWSVTVKAGRVQLLWDTVTAEMAGDDDLSELGVSYEIWGRPYPQGDQTSWRRLHHLMAHEGAPAVAIDTFFETAVTAVWAFKLRIGNRNGYGPFSQEVWLSTGQLPSEPVALSASVALNGQIALTWRAPVSDGYLPLTGMLFSPPSGLVTCELRAVNAVGASLAAQSFVTLL